MYMSLLIHGKDNSKIKAIHNDSEFLVSVIKYPVNPWSNWSPYLHTAFKLNQYYVRLLSIKAVNKGLINIKTKNS